MTVTLASALAVLALTAYLANTVGSRWLDRQIIEHCTPDN